MRALIRFGAWWAVSFVLWLLLTSTLDTQELAAGIIASCISAFAASIVQSNEEFGFRPRLRWLSRARILPGQVIADCWVAPRATACAASRSAWRASPSPYRSHRTPMSLPSTAPRRS